MLKKRLLEIDGLKIYGEKANRTSVVSFNLEGIGIVSDVGMILDKLGIAVRTGHHCTQPIMEFFKIAGTVRVSFAVYNTLEEVDALVEGVKKGSKNADVNFKNFKYNFIKIKLPKIDFREFLLLLKKVLFNNIFKLFSILRWTFLRIFFKSFIEITKVIKSAFVTYLVNNSMVSLPTIS